MRRGRLLILVGLILAIGTAAAVFWVMTRSTPTDQVAVVEREEVVVAVQPILEDELLEGRVELRAMPVETIPEGALRALESTTGMLAAGPIPQGTILQPELIISPSELAREGKLGKIVEEGYVAMAFPIDEMSSVSYGIQPGDHVDVLMTFFFVDVDQNTQVTEPICPPLCPGFEEEREANLTDQRPRLASQLTLQDVEVLGVGRWSYGPSPLDEQTADTQQTRNETPVEPPQYMTVMLSPQDALVIKLAREYGASIDFAVRAQDDHQQFATQQVTLDYILARFGVTQPVKQPYAIDAATETRPEANVP
jgi:pilus assembly protein CpaB